MLFFLLISPLNGLGAYSSTSSPMDREGNAPTPNLLATEVVVCMVVNSLGHVPGELRRMVQQQGGIVVEDVEEREDQSNVRFTIRIDSAATESFVSAVLGLGQMDERRVTVREVSKELADLESLQTTRQATLQRYDQLLARATTISDALAIENERHRIEGEIEQGRAQQRQLHDRVLRSILYVRLSTASRLHHTAKW